MVHRQEELPEVRREECDGCEEVSSVCGETAEPRPPCRRLRGSQSRAQQCDPRLRGAFLRDVTGTDACGDVRPGEPPRCLRVNPGPEGLQTDRLPADPCGCGLCWRVCRLPRWVWYPREPSCRGATTLHPASACRLVGTGSLWAVVTALFFVCFCAFCWCFHS